MKIVAKRNRTAVIESGSIWLATKEPTVNETDTSRENKSIAKWPARASGLTFKNISTAILN